MKACAALTVLALMGAPAVGAFDYQIVDAGSINLIDAATGIVGTSLAFLARLKSKKRFGCAAVRARVD